MTEKENFMKVINGETPGWVPRYYGGVDPYSSFKPACLSVSPSPLAGTPLPTGRRDIFGVEFVATEETGGQALPKPGEFIVKDIRKWRDVIKTPDFSGVDWEAVAKQDIEKLKIDRNETALILSAGGGVFMFLMNFMGFTEGLCALSEEPEAVHEMYQYLIDFYAGILKKTIKLYKPDVVTVGDDTATAFNPFISAEMQREMIKPYHKVLCDIAREENIPLMMHCCGRCEDFIDDWMDIGVSSWNPAQVTNDLAGIKKKYGNKMVLIGCWDSSGPAGYVDAPEDLVRSAVKDAVMTYGPGGGYMFWGSTYGPPGTLLTNKRTWMTTEYEKWREAPYK